MYIKFHKDRTNYKNFFRMASGPLNAGDLYIRITTEGNTIQTGNSPTRIRVLLATGSEAKDCTQQHTDSTMLSVPALRSNLQSH